MTETRRRRRRRAAPDNDLPGAPEVSIEPASISYIETTTDRAREYAKASRSPATRRAYGKQWRWFTAWCEARGVTPQPASGVVVALYLTSWADEGAAVATMAQGLSAISVAHTAAGEPSPRVAPEVREVWQGIRRTQGVAQRQAARVGPDELRAMIRAMGRRSWVPGLRDRARDHVNPAPVGVCHEAMKLRTRTLKLQRSPSRLA